jgi:hypothetical protein
MKWCQREEWREPFNKTLTLHLGEACAEAGVAFEELPAIIGDHFGVLWRCAFEDFLAREGEDGRYIVDDYLKRRSWNESASNKRYMTALRTSVMSLYEISGIVRDEGFLARDLIRGGEPVRVSEKSGTHTLKQWDCIAVRVVEIGSRLEMTGGRLPFTHADQWRTGRVGAAGDETRWPDRRVEPPDRQQFRSERRRGIGPARRIAGASKGALHPGCRKATRGGIRASGRPSCWWAIRASKI